MYHYENFKPSFLLITGIIILFFLSLVGFMVPAMNTALWILLLAVVFFGTLIKLEFGILAIMMEAFLGGHGYLFSLPVGSFTISLRIAFFSVVSLAWIYHSIRTKKLPRILSLPIKYPIGAFVLFVILGGIIGILRNNGSLIFYDINAYFALWYCVLFLDAYKRKIQLHRLARVATSSLIALALLTIFIFVTFSTVLYDPSLKGALSVDESVYELLQSLQGQEGSLAQKIFVKPNDVVLHPEDITATKPLLYRWLRNTGVAEISYVSGRFFRVFFPSHILLLFWLFIPLWTLFSKKMVRKVQLGNIVVVLLGLAALFIGFSRSLWLGLLAGLLLGVIALLNNKAYRKKTLKFFTITGIACIILLALTGAYKPIIERAKTIIRPNLEVAATHRISLLKAIGERVQKAPLVGSGFGTTVSFPTVYGSGSVAVVAFYVFEWAYFDMAVKMGIIGLLAFLWLLIKLSKDLLRTWLMQYDIFFLGLLCGIVALAIANISTPIFTHPLGIIALAIILPFLYATKKNSGANSNLE